MPVLTFPNIKPTSAGFQQISNTQSFTSPLSKTTQTLELPGARWGVDVSFNNLTPVDARLFKAFLTKLRGAGGRFYYGDPDYLIDGPLGVNTGTPLVDGASQVGNTLNVKGWTTSVTDILKAGDYVQFTNTEDERELHMIVEDVNSDAGGLTALTVEPAIRVSPADNAAIVVTDATCQMRLIDDKQAGWKFSTSMFGNIQFKAIESFTNAT